MNQQQLTKILEQHRAWVEGTGEARANLTGAVLTGANLTGAYLNRADLTGADLTRANLTRANLTRANLTGAYLTSANLTGANLTGANLTGAVLTGANLTGAYLNRADLTGAVLTGADLTGANLTSANLTRADLNRADLTGANLTGTCLDPALLMGQRAFAKARRSRGIVLYRTAASQFAGTTQYVPGRTYVANALSFDSATACHPGIYGYTTLAEVAGEYPGQRYVRIYVRDGDWVWTSKGCPRCARVRVLNYVD